jgi:transposase
VDWKTSQNNFGGKMIALCKFEDKYKEKTKEELIKELYDSYVEKEKLEKELKKYKNSNTPSSANKHLKETTQGLKAKKGAKRGAPKNHRGTTLILSEPEVFEEVFVDNCPDCNSTDIRPTGYVKVKKVICYQKAKTYVKEYKQAEYVCVSEGKLFFAPHKDIPEKGIYDKNIQSLVNYYKFKARMPHSIVVDTMNNIHDVPMTEATSLAITRRASDKLEPLYQKLEEEIKKADVVHGDETSHSVMGINHWIWVFCNEILSLFKFKKERGGEIVEETLGKDFQGKLVSDGWQTYTSYTKNNNIIHQRCLDHLRREVKYECKKKHPHLYKWCCDIYFMVKKGKNYKQEKRRLEMYKKCKAELSLLTHHMKAHINLKKLVTKIQNGADKWFNCILYPELPMDNNEAERSLRPFVIIRKIIGCLRSEIGKKNYEVMMSLMSTWEKQQKNIFYMLQTNL